MGTRGRISSFWWLLLGMVLFLASCNRSINSPTELRTPAVNTLIAAGTKPPTLAAAIATTAPTRLASATEPVAETPAAVKPSATSANPESPRTLAVILLSDVDLLNVRVAPGLSGDVLLTLPSHQRDLHPTGQREKADEVEWVEINLPDGRTGWASSEFLTEQVAGDVFCQDARVSTLLDQFTTSIKEKDAEMLPGLVSPLRGLTIYHNVWNPPVHFDSPDVLKRLYASTVDYDWGIQDGSGTPLVGPFKDLVFPKLQDVLSFPHTRHCNVLEQNVSVGGTTGRVEWPAEYTNMNFVALYRAAPANQEMNWRTWVVGIEYVDGVPYLAVLMQFYWEI